MYLFGFKGARCIHFKGMQEPQQQPQPRRFILLILGYCHPKNLHGFRLMSEAARAQYVETGNVQEAVSTPCDVLWIPFGYLPPILFAGARRIVYGPHNFVFPTGKWLVADWSDYPQASYNCLSEWNRAITAKCLEATPARYELSALPFPVDVNAFRPSAAEKELDCFIYVKKRRPEHLACVLEVLKEVGKSLGKDLAYRIINYGEGATKYKEEDYKAVLASARYGIWVGRHESQGFALEEALSCNVPLLVWDVKQMGDEWNERSGRSEYDGDYPATCIPYWSSECGLVVKEADELSTAVRAMNTLYATFRPRDYVLRRLSPIMCAMEWLGL
jgi:glycosyltransferase involved in cell wall biosynthesis